MFEHIECYFKALSISIHILLCLVFLQSFFARYEILGMETDERGKESLEI